jgi:hypothetical protein
MAIHAHGDAWQLRLRLVRGAGMARLAGQARLHVESVTERHRLLGRHRLSATDGGNEQRGQAEPRQAS